MLSVARGVFGAVLIAHQTGVEVDAAIGSWLVHR
jgi:hypothetical protein